MEDGIAIISTIMMVISMAIKSFSFVLTAPMAFDGTILVDRVFTTLKLDRN